MKKRVVVQCSGGVESTVALGLAISEYGRDCVYPIAFDDSSVSWKHKDSLAVKRVVTNLQLSQNLFICSVPQSDFLEYSRNALYDDVGFIPGLKMFFNTASLSFAHKVGAEEVWVGNMADNIYPDEKPNFLTRTFRLYNDTYGTDIKIVSPFQHFEKSQVLHKGLELGIDVFDTMSCGDDRVAGCINCGKCAWCIKRRNAFKEGGIEDKTFYLFG